MTSSRKHGAGLTAVERLETLCDAGSLRPVRPAWLAQSCPPRLAVVGGHGRVHGRPIVCYAQDSSLMGGSVGTAEAEMIVRILRIGRSEGLPLIAFLQSGGARLQEGAASLGGFGRIFLENIALSGVVPQISVITGSAAGGVCYSPALTDFVVMTESASMFLTGPLVVHEAVGERVTAAALGGPRIHERTGVCHFVAPDDLAAISVARELLGYLPQRAGHLPPSCASEPAPDYDPAAVVPVDGRRVYDVRAVARTILDGGRLFEVSARWARNLVTGFGRIAGQAVGVIANQPHHRGGVIDADASQKGSWFVRTCNVYRLPLVVLVDTPGFMPGAKQEAAGVIRYGAQLLRAFAEATVPRVTVVLRKAYGGAYITMNSRDMGADLAVAWPDAEIGVMSARAAARIIHRRELDAARDREEVIAKLSSAYTQRHLSAVSALGIGLIDEIIEPRQTRRRLMTALAAGSLRRAGASPDRQFAVSWQQPER